jgi:hypothetical protein
MRLIGVLMEKRGPHAICQLERREFMRRLQVIE